MDATRVLLGFICETMASLKKCRLAQQTAHYIMLFFNYAQCTFWKVVNNRTVQFKWVAGVQKDVLSSWVMMISQTRAQ